MNKDKTQYLLFLQGLKSHYEKESAKGYSPNERESAKYELVCSLLNKFDTAEHPTAPTVENKKDGSSELQLALNAYFIEHNWNDKDRTESVVEMAENSSWTKGYVACLKAVHKIHADNKLLREALQNREGSFYMDICRAYNAGKENAFAMVAENKKMGETSATFKPSHDYFIEEFPGFKTNVP